MGNYIEKFEGFVKKIYRPRKMKGGVDLSAKGAQKTIRGRHRQIEAQLKRATGRKG